MRVADRYGKAEVHLVHLDRSGPQHVVTDLLVTTALEGEFAATHERGDNTGLMATDSQKNLVYCQAREEAPGAPEGFALRVARLLAGVDGVHRAQVDVTAQAWRPVAGAAFERDGGARRRATAVVHAGGGEHVLGGFEGLAVMKTAGSGFAGFARDRWTSLPDTDDRVLATEVLARWRLASADADADAEHDRAREVLGRVVAEERSDALQQTLHTIGEGILEACPGIVEVRLALPNLHHLLVDLGPYGLDNPNVVFHADDRPYGLIEGTFRRDGAAAEEDAWRGRLR